MPKTLKYLAVYNPATGEGVGTVAECGINETHRAVDATHNAFITGAANLQKYAPTCCDSVY